LALLTARTIQSHAVDGGLFGWVLFTVLSVALLYRLIRTAVAHGVADAEKKRRKANRKSR